MNPRIAPKVFFLSDSRKKWFPSFSLREAGMRQAGGVAAVLNRTDSTLPAMAYVATVAMIVRMMLRHFIVLCHTSNINLISVRKKTRGGVAFSTASTAPIHLLLGPVSHAATPAKRPQRFNPNPQSSIQGRTWYPAFGP